MTMTEEKIKTKIELSIVVWIQDKQNADFLRNKFLREIKRICKLYKVSVEVVQ